VEATLLKKATGDTEAKAIEAARKLIKEYETSVQTRRKVIIVYNPTEESFGRFHYGNLLLDPVCIRFEFKVVDEVTVDDERQFIGDNGRSQWFSMDDFAVIPYTPEREAYFAKAKEAMQRSKDNLRTFLENCEAKPALIDKAIAAGALLLEASK
jgi:hypothetical protein